MIEALAIKTGQLIFVGAALSCGFWLGKKLTNQIDYVIGLAICKRELIRGEKQ